MTTPHPHEGIAAVELADQMRDLFQMMVRHVHKGLAAAGFDDVRPAHMTIFQHLQPEGSRIGELAEKSQLTNQSVGYLVDYLEEHGYVERRTDPRNRRATLVCLTDKGWAEMQACANIFAAMDKELSNTVGKQRLTQLKGLLSDFEGALRKLD